MADRPELEFKPSPVRCIFWSLAMVAVIVVAATALWRFWQLKQAEEIGRIETEIQEEQPAVSGTEGNVTEGKQDEENDEFVARADTTVTFPSPPDSINDSDAWLRQQLPVAEPDPRFRPWLDDTRDILRKFVLLVSQVAEGRVPRQVFVAWVPQQPFRVREVGDGQYVIDPAGYHRYDKLAEVVDAVDVDLAWRLYRHLKPLIDEAFAEFAPPGTRFEDVLLAAVEHLLQTPQPRGEIRLIRPSALYQFADPRLEALSPAQKLLIRMGPVNATIIKHKLGLLRGLLLQQQGIQD